MPRLKVTQIRSKVGNPPDQRDTLRSLGLKRIGDVVVKEDRPEIRGMVYAVRHFVITLIINFVVASLFRAESCSSILQAPFSLV